MSSHAALLPLDASGRDPGYVLIATGGVPIRLSQSAGRLLDAVASGMSFEALARMLSRDGRTVSAPQLQAAYERLTARVEEIAERAAKAPSPFLLRLGVLSASWVERLAHPLSWLFQPRIAIASLTLAGAALTVFVYCGALGVRVSGSDHAWSYTLFALSMLCHELGHASACCRFGVAPGAIGLTLYLIYPAFYADVTRAWRLPRRQRVVVDLGGMYLQLLVAALYGVIHVVTGIQAWAEACGWILLACLVSLNPLFKFDGYWVLADVLGMDRLGYRALQSWRQVGARLRARRSAASQTPPLKLTWPLAVLLLYGPLGLAAWSLFICRLVPRITTALRSLQAIWLQIVADHTVLWEALDGLLAPV